MSTPTERLRRIGRGAAIALGVLVLVYAMVVVRPNPVAGAWKAHEKRGRELGTVRPVARLLEADLPSPYPQYIPPPWRAQEYDPWLVRQLGIEFTSHAVASSAFDGPSTEEAAHLAVRERSLLHPVLFDNCGRLPGPDLSEPGWAGDPAEWESRRAGVEKLMEAIPARVEADSGNRYSESHIAVPPAIAYLALRGRDAEARGLLDRFLAARLADPGYYRDGTLWYWGQASATAAPPETPVSVFDYDPFVAAALLLDAAGVDNSYLDSIAEALANEVPSAEKRAWLLDDAFFESVAAEEAMVAATVPKDEINVFDELPCGHLMETVILEAQRPILKASLRESSMAFRRGDAAGAIAAHRRFEAVYRRMGLSGSPSMGMPESAVEAKWFLRAANQSDGMRRVETARFVVAALRFRRAEGRWPGGLEDLVPKWLAPGAVGADGAQWAVEELPAYDVPVVAKGDGAEAPQPELMKGPAAKFRDYLAKEGAPPDSLALQHLTEGAPTRHIAARPIFYRTGPTDRFHPFFWRELKRLPETGREAYDKQLESNLVKWRSVEAYGPLSTPDPRALLLLKPRGS